MTGHPGEHEQGEDVSHLAIVELSVIDHPSSVMRSGGMYDEPGDWVLVRCVVCETEHEPEGLALPQRFTCDGCGAVNVVQP